MINSVTNITPGTSSVGQVQGRGMDSLGQGDFLKLLTVQMQQQDPSMLGSARFDALCNVIGDYSENPSSSALEAVVKTTVRLAGSFNSDKAFAQQLQRKIFPQIVASEAQQEAATPVRASAAAW